MPRINVTVSESQKDDWDSHVEENPGIDSLSDLVRTAVTEYMADENSSGGELNDAVVDDLVNTLDDIEGQLGDLETSVDKLHRRNVEEDEIDDIVALHTDPIPDAFLLDYIIRDVLAGLDMFEDEDLARKYTEEQGTAFAKIREDNREFFQNDNE